MPRDEVQPIQELSRGSPGGSAASLEIIPSVDSMSSRSSANSSEMSYRQYIDLPPHEPLTLISREPFLDEILREVAGTRDLRTLDEVQLKLSSSMVCIQDLNVFLPNLVSLNLEGSSLNSLRDLGIHLRVKHLNVSRCGLRSLDGTSGLTTIVDLVADDNTIRSVAALCNLTDLHRMSIRNNFLFNVDAVSFMALCPKLSHLDLTGNPVCGVPDYRTAIKAVVPSIQILDDCVMLDQVPEEVPSLSSSEYSSSAATSHSEQKPCSPEEFSELTKSVAPTKLRLGSAQSAENAGCSDGVALRPRTADSPRPSLAQGTPISGNIVTAARRKKSAWGSASSTSCSELESLSSNSSMGSDGAAALNLLRETNIIEEAIALEIPTMEIKLDVTPIRHSRSNETHGVDSSSAETLQLLEESRELRERYQKMIDK